MNCLPRLLAFSIQPFSPWELAEKEAFALEGYAGAVGDDHDKAIRALRKASELLARRTLLGSVLFWGNLLVHSGLEQSKGLFILYGP